MEESTTRSQLNVRVSPQLTKLIDDKRVKLRDREGRIPSRSDVLRLALEAYLGVDLSKLEADGRRSKGS